MLISLYFPVSFAQEDKMSFRSLTEVGPVGVQAVTLGLVFGGQREVCVVVAQHSITTVSLGFGGTSALLIHLLARAGSVGNHDHGEDRQEEESGLHCRLVVLSDYNTEKLMFNLKNAVLFIPEMCDALFNQITIA